MLFQVMRRSCFTKRNVLIKYKDVTYGNSPLLDTYINDHFAMNGKLNFSNMNLIVNLLLCCVPNTFQEFVPLYRAKG
jgi:hypothetical protein